MLRILKNSRGFSLIEGVIAAAALGILAFAGFQMFSDVGKQMANTGVSAGVNLARTTMLDAVNSSLAWSNTLAENPSLACIQNRTSCAALIGTQVGVKVIDGSGTIILADPADTAVGFDPEGRSCHTFPSPACPIRFDVTWTPVCTVAACTNAQEKVTGIMTVKSSNNPADDKYKNLLQTSTYSFSALRGAGFSSFADMCKALEGLWNNSTKTCTLPLIGPCPNGQVVVGIDNASNQKICRQLWLSGGTGYGGTCAPGQVMKGLDASGNPLCVAIDPTTCHSACYTNPSLCVIWTPGPGPGPGSDGSCGGSDGGGGLGVVGGSH